MIIALVLATASVSILVFLAGYRLACKHHSDQQQAFLEMLNADNSTGEPIFAALDREWLYTEELNKPFTDEK